MNHTNRALNRAIALIVGLVALAAGAAAILAVAWPAATTIWSDALTGAADAAQSAAASTRIADSTASWAGIGAVAVGVVVIVLLLVPIGLLTRGRSRAVLRSAEGEATTGRVVVREGFASDAVTASLDARGDILSTRVVADNVRDEPVLHISVTPRQNASPREIADHVGAVASRLNTLLGHSTRTYISLHAGLRARLASDRRNLT